MSKWPSAENDSASLQRGKKALVTSGASVACLPCSSSCFSASLCLGARLWGWQVCMELLAASFPVLLCGSRLARDEWLRGGTSMCPEPERQGRAGSWRNTQSRPENSPWPPGSGERGLRAFPPSSVPGLPQWGPVLDQSLWPQASAQQCTQEMPLHCADTAIVGQVHCGL